MPSDRKRPESDKRLKTTTENTPNKSRPTTPSPQKHPTRHFNDIKEEAGRKIQDKCPNTVTIASGYKPISEPGIDVPQSQTRSRQKSFDLQGTAPNLEPRPGRKSPIKRVGAGDKADRPSNSMITDPSPLRSPRMTKVQRSFDSSTCEMTNSEPGKRSKRRVIEEKLKHRSSTKVRCVCNGISWQNQLLIQM